MRAKHFVAVSVLAILAAASSNASPTERPSGTPSAIIPADRFDYTRIEADIPMRDGVTLRTIILRPKALTGRQPILLDRTPYNAASFAARGRSTQLAAMLGGRFDTVLESGYILVFQDIRGKYGSKGDYRLAHPPRGPLNTGATDHATDTNDTIDWLLKNVPDNNGRVGMIGVSYDGWTTLMALLDPHPALKAAVPINPMVDTWIGDDFFHRGAFRTYALDYIFDQSATRANSDLFQWSHTDEYSAALAAGSTGDRARALGMEKLPNWRVLTEHPNYDAYWRDQAVDRLLAARGLRVPTLLVHGLFDQEDIYGAPALRAALAKDPASLANLTFVMGPWYHGQPFRGEASAIGPIRWGSDTGAHFRRTILQPFLDAHLKDGAPPARLAPVIGFETGANRWHDLSSWPLSCASGCPASSRALFLQPDGALGFDRRVQGVDARYVSDPARPVPYVPRPIRAPFQDLDRWRAWLVSDQRHASARPDVLVFQTAPLERPVRIAGEPVANLTVTTDANDGDFVVKLIDVHPDEVPGQPELGGYEMMVSGDIIRGRFRNDPARPEPFVPGRATPVRFALPHAHHVFRRGHRIMVQVQSSWFPLYDRNPQRFVPNIFFAKSGDYRAATIRVRTAGPNASFVELPVVP